MKKILIIVLIIVVFAGIGFFGYKYYLESKNSPYREAVFLDNGQVYFGRIERIDQQFMKLSDVYYLKTDDLQSSDPEKKIVLVKMGSELHGPEDAMYINRSQVLFYQKIQDASKINKAIEQFVQKNSDNSVQTSGTLN